MAKRYKIHPAIGISRLGFSAEWHPGPTTPGVPPSPGDDGSYRDSNKGLKCQAAAFWVFEYDNTQPAADPVLVHAGPGQPVMRVEWRVHIANKKAFWFDFDGLTGSKDVTNPPGFGYGPTPNSWRNSNITDPTERRKQLIIDPGSRTISSAATFATFDKGTGGGYPETWPAPLQNAAGPASIDSLGMMQVHHDWSMSVIPAPGISGSTSGSTLIGFANNPGWFDNTSDGPVRATVVLADGTRVEADPAWVMVTPPDFAPAVENIVTLYDVLFDVGVRHFQTRPDIFGGPAPSAVDDFTSTVPPFNPAHEPSYRDDVYPILLRAAQYAWIHQAGDTVHPKWDLNALSANPFVDGTNPFSPLDLFKVLRQPEDWETNPDKRLMPILLGDTDSGSRLTLTPTQYHVMRQWSEGKFSRERWVWPAPSPSPSPVPKAAELDRAALEACAGGAFYPGIEMGWIAREWKLYVKPFEFRFRHAPTGGDPLGIDAGSDPHALYPGDATKRMACPWQADFWKCQQQWWPAQRPDEVFTNAAAATREPWARRVQMVAGTAVSGHMGMAVNWHQLGVVAPQTTAGGLVVQVERDRQLP